MSRNVLLAAVLLALCACRSLHPPAPSVELPPLRLAPASQPAPLALQQQLQFRMGPHVRQMMALLESDASSVRLAVQAMGQTGVRLSWDGQHLQQQRAPWLPPQVRAERVLDDLQFALWPVAAVAAALPADWALEVNGQVRQLRHADAVWLESRRQEDGGLQLRNHAEGYELLIHSVDLVTGEAR